MPNETHTFTGQLVSQVVEDEVVLSLVNNEYMVKPLAEWVEFKIPNVQRFSSGPSLKVKARYYVSDKPATEAELNEQYMRIISGQTLIEFMVHGSEISGTWLNNNLYIGDHNLLKELKPHLGKWLWLEIEVLE